MPTERHRRQLPPVDACANVQRQGQVLPQSGSSAGEGTVPSELDFFGYLDSAKIPTQSGPRWRPSAAGAGTAAADRVPTAKRDSPRDRRRVFSRPDWRRRLPQNPRTLSCRRYDHAEISGNGCLFGAHVDASAACDAVFAKDTGFAQSYAELKAGIM